jgi:predicted TPR repeat methyltransferase
MNKKKQKWNKIFSDSSTYYLLEMKKEIDYVLNVIPDAKKILDLGCGKGELVCYLSDKGFDVKGVDISDVAIKYGQEKCGNGASFILGDLENFSKVLKQEEKFDLIFLKFVFSFIEDKDVLLKNIDNSLNEKGFFVLIGSVGKGDNLHESFISYKDLENVSNYFSLYKKTILLKDKKGELFIFIFKKK